MVKLLPDLVHEITGAAGTAQVPELMVAVPTVAWSVHSAHVDWPQPDTTTTPRASSVPAVTADNGRPRFARVGWVSGTSSSAGTAASVVPPSVGAAGSGFRRATRTNISATYRASR